MQLEAVPEVSATLVICVPLAETLPRRMKYKWLSSEMHVRPPTPQLDVAAANVKPNPTSTDQTTPLAARDP